MSALSIYAPQVHCSNHPLHIELLIFLVGFSQRYDTGVSLIHPHEPPEIESRDAEKSVPRFYTNVGCSVGEVHALTSPIILYQFICSKHSPNYFQLWP